MISIAYAGDSTAVWKDQLTDPEITVAGGFSSPGYTSTQIAANITAVNCDVLVVMVGVNDIRLGVSTATILANIESIVSTVGAQHVIICAIVPCDITDYGTAHINRQEKGEVFNRALIDLAFSHGWLFVDPSNQFRKIANGYKSATGMSDGVHPTTASYQLIAARIEGYARIAVNGASA